MRIATTIFLTDRTVSPTRLARSLEERGFSGLYLPEHTHIPVSRDTDAPMGGELPEQYGRTLDPFVALGQAAAVTERLHLGTGITLVAQHDPIGLAKQAATLDHLSGGRLTLGIGYGWNVEEAADHGVDWRTRRERVRDHMALMRALWSPEPTAYEGPYASVRASAAHPKPVQPPRELGPGRPLYGPRTLIGGAAGPKLFAAVADHADGWLPIGGRGLTEALPALRRVWEDAGRDPKELRVVPYAVQPTPGKMGHYADLGIEEVVLQLPSAREAEVLRHLDDFAQYL
ncbi:TIGR03619 family F420-dependent LLM class oxidoreductase [Streptomyces sp. NPDC048352]|uniref:TIGR03619 family F420-dependent LLM class oxidoreductase n=1 Tax=Streptomyces sp. NPDC048352 TaxID=3154718 RepID=UPI0034291449